MANIHSLRVSKAAIAVGAAFLILAAAFNGLDLYRTLFYSTDQFDHVSYNVARFACVVFLLLVEFALGQAPLYLLRKRGPEVLLAPEEEIAISVLSGSAILRAIMLLLGFAGLYYWWLIAVGGTIAVIAGWDRFALLWRSFTTARFNALRECNWFERIAAAGLIAALFFGAFEVVLEKLILPNGPRGTGDFYSHYYPYMQLAVAKHNIWPNDVWYHFFVSKTFGEEFFAILVSGPLGVQVASCSMFFAALLIMFCFVDRATRDPLVALAATAATATGFIWTVDYTLGFGYWADFPKEHVITAVLWFGCIWVSWRARLVSRQDLPYWGVLTALVFSGLILARVQFAVIAVIFLFAMLVWSILSRRRELALAYACQIGAVVVTAVFVLGLNYLVIGMAEMTPFRPFWSFADQERFAHWASPFLMLLLQLGSSTGMGSFRLSDVHLLPLQTLLIVFRLDRAAPFMGPAGATFIIVLGFALLGLIKAKDAERGGPFGSPGLDANARCLRLGASGQQIKLDRRSGSTCFVCSRSSLWRHFHLPSLARRWGPSAAPSSRSSWQCNCSSALNMRSRAFKFKVRFRSFAMGRSNIADVFAGDQALWPQGLSMSRVAGAGTPIWNSQLLYYCAAPECNFETFFFVFDGSRNTRASCSNRRTLLDPPCNGRD